MTASISFSCPSGVWSAVRIVTGLVPSDVLHWRLIEPGVEMSKRVSCGQEVPPDCDAAWRHVRHRRSQIVRPGVRGGDLQQEQAGNGNGHRVAEFTAAICAHLVFSLLRATAAATRARNSSTGIRRMPSVRNVRVAVSNTAKALESCVTVSLAGSRIARNAEGSLDPTRHRESSRARPLQKHDGVISRMEFGRALDGGGQMPDAPARQADRNFAGQISLQGLHDFERRHRPDRAVFPSRFGARTAHARHGVGSCGQLIEAEPRERGGANGRQE